MNKWRIVFLMLLCSMLLTSAQAVQLVPFTPHGVTCDLINDTFENTDGVDITTHGWTAEGTDPGDFVEIDTAQFNGGSSSVLFDNNGDENEYIVYMPFTQQTTGKFTIDVYGRFTGGANAYIVELDIGTRSFSTTTALYIQRSGANIQAYYSSSFNNLCTSCITQNVWHHFEIEVDMDSNIYDVWLDDSQIGTDVPFQSNVDPNRFYLLKRTATAGDNAHLDTLCMYTGARQ